MVLVSLEMPESLEFPGSRETGERQEHRDLAVTLELQESQVHPVQLALTARLGRTDRMVKMAPLVNGERL